MKLDGNSAREINYKSAFVLSIRNTQSSGDNDSTLFSHDLGGREHFDGCFIRRELAGSDHCDDEICLPHNRLTLVVIDVEDHGLCFTSGDGISHILENKNDGGAGGNDCVAIETRDRDLVQVYISLRFSKHSSCVTTDLNTDCDLSGGCFLEGYLRLVRVCLLSYHSQVVVSRDIVSRGDREGVVS